MLPRFKFDLLNCLLTLIKVAAFFAFALHSPLSHSILTPTLKFKHLKDQLSQISINDIEKDKLGLIWIATNSGLNRFDGYSVKTYLSQQGKSIKLYTTEDQDLYALTSSGVYFYDIEKDVFTESPYDALLDNAYSGTTDLIINNGMLYLSTDDGEVLQVNDNSIIRFSLNSSIPDKNHVNHPYKIYLDKSEDVYIGTHYGLWKKQSNDNNFQLISETKNLTIRSITSLNNDELALATEDGLFIFNKPSNKVKKISFNNSELKKENRLRDVIKSDNDTLWIASFNGLINYNYLNDKVYFYQNIPSDSSSLSSNLINQLFFDNNTLWVGTDASGLDYVSLDTKEFGLYQSQYQDNECLSGNTIYAIEGQHNSLWLAVWEKGIHKINYGNNSCELIEKTNSENSITSNYVIALESTETDLWIGQSGRGLSRLNIESNKITNFQQETSNPNSLVHQDVFAIKEGGDKNIWIGTLYGLSKYNTDKNSFTNFRENDSDLHSNQIFTLEIDSKNQLWFGTKNGIDLFDIQNNTFTRSELPDTIKALTTEVYSLNVSKNGDMWIGTLNDGLWRISKDNEVTSWNKSNGLPDNTIYNIKEDSFGDIWATTNKGIFRLTPNSNRIIAYTAELGLQANEFTTAGYFSENDNSLYFSGTEGFNKIDIENIRQDNKNKKPLISKFLIENQEYEIAKNLKISNGKAIGSTNKIELDYTFDFIGFEFISTDYYFSDIIKYRYKLSGYSERWINTDSSNRVATFTNLPHGNFRLLIEASDRFGQFNGPTTELNILVKPPFWLTWWAKVSYLLALLITPYLIYLYRSKALRKKARSLEIAVKKRTEELTKEKKNVERLLAFKNEEFANVSHEFRTPLTLVLGPLKKLLENEQEESKRRRMMTIKNNAYRLLRMVDQLIFMEKFRFKKEVIKKSINVSKLVSEYVTNFRDLAAEKGITINLSSEDEIYFSSMPDAIQKIVLNLISNSLKYTQKNGVIDVSLRSIGEEQFEFSVKDNGIGIAPDMHDKIFNRYTRVFDERSEKVTGAGIGLSLVKELVEHHKGTIRLDSQLNEGSCFYVTLPKSLPEESSKKNEYSNSIDDSIDELFDVELENLSSQITAEKDNLENTEYDESIESNKLTVLVIDDNPSIRSYLKEILQEEYNVLTSEDGKAGIEMAEEHIPDLIISDIMMPSFDGYQVTETLKSNILTSHIPIILLTARGDTESRLKGWKINADEYLTKPFDEHELKLRVGNLLSIRRLIQTRYAASTSEIASPDSPESSQNVEEEFSTVDKRFIDECEAIIEKFYQDNQFSSQRLSREIGLSDRQLQRKLKGLIGQSPSDFIRNFRLRRAKTALSEGLPIKAVAFDHGFSSVSYFSRCFKAYFGVTPGQSIDQ
ncbi:hybrid sensor histidine kinase/response regulator transcription factor [Pleionea sediminis]|uniref:hybrid sensor histidine kinase/response regulator transcription factor n=1 Tax=Pleionea sediminis TaxID=2569479 RepID=UPI0011869D72|nr:ATP-binding protein [Pleionea sediminis]